MTNEAPPLGAGAFLGVAGAAEGEGLDLRTTGLPQNSQNRLSSGMTWAQEAQVKSCAPMFSCRDFTAHLSGSHNSFYARRFAGIIRPNGREENERQKSVHRNGWRSDRRP